MNFSSAVPVMCLVILSMAYAKPAKVRNPKNSPKSQKLHNTKKFTPNWKSCSDKISSAVSLCNGTNQYPESAIKKLVSRWKVKTTSKSVIQPASEMALAREPGKEPQNLCRTRRFTVLPKMALEKNSQELWYIVNVKNFEQAVIFETCVDKDKSCFGMDPDPFPTGKKTKCIQKYSDIRLAAVNVHGKPEFGQFQVPSTCVCSYVDMSDWTLK